MELVSVGRREEKAYEFLYSCCVVSSLMKFIAWTEIVIYTTTITLSILSIAVSNGSWSDILSVGAIFSLLPVALIHPITPPFLLHMAIRYCLPSVTWKTTNRGGGSLPLFVGEIIFLVIHTIMALVLVRSCTKKDLKGLRIWTVFSGFCMVIVTLETIIFALSFAFDQLNLLELMNYHFLEVMIRLGVSAIVFLYPMGAVFIFSEEIIRRERYSVNSVENLHLSGTATN